MERNTKLIIAITIDVSGLKDEYTNIPLPVEKRIVRWDDPFDPERAKEYKFIVQLVEAGVLRKVTNQHSEEVVNKNPLFPDDFAMLLIKNWCRTEKGIYGQKIYSAHLDGYLTAFAEISKFITKLYRYGNPYASMVNNALKPLFEDYSGSYEAMINLLNDTEFFDKL